MPAPSPIDTRPPGDGSVHEPVEAVDTAPLPAHPPIADVADLAARRIARALIGRTRYKYVRPSVLREGAGWKVVSPNCSRNIDAAGGQIDIAWLVPSQQNRWQLHARDHALGQWRLMREDTSLPALLDHLCADPNREYWQ